jgi:hypothetical protein
MGGFTLGFGSKKLGVQNISFMDITFGLKIGPKLEMGFSNWKYFLEEGPLIFSMKVMLH